MDSPVLFHLTCGHGRKGIGRSGGILPGRPHPWGIFPGLVWMTTDPDAGAEALGLTSEILPCVRTRFVYRVAATAAGPVPWVGSPYRTREAIEALEGPEQRPALWWVSPHSVRGRLVRVRAAADPYTSEAPPD